MTFFNYADKGVLWRSLAGLSIELNFLLLIHGIRKHLNLWFVCVCVSDIPFTIASKCDAEDRELSQVTPICLLFIASGQSSSSDACLGWRAANKKSCE